MCRLTVGICQTAYIPEAEGMCVYVSVCSSADVATLGSIAVSQLTC